MPSSSWRSLHYPPLGRGFPRLVCTHLCRFWTGRHSSGWLDRNWGPKSSSSEPRTRASAPGRPSPPGGRGVAPRIQPLPSPSAPPATLPPSSSERPLLADRRGMSSGGSRHVTRRRSSSSPSRGSNFQPQPWEQRRAALAPPGRGAASGRVRRRRPVALRRSRGLWVSLWATKKPSLFLLQPFQINRAVLASAQAKSLEKAARSEVFLVTQLLRACFCSVQREVVTSPPSVFQE